MASKLSLAKDFKESFSVTVVSKKGTSETSPDKSSMVIHRHGGFPVAATQVATKPKAIKRDEPITCSLSNQPPEKVQRTTTSVSQQPVLAVTTETTMPSMERGITVIEAIRTVPVPDVSSVVHSAGQTKNNKNSSSNNSSSSSSSSSNGRSAAPGIMVRHGTRPSLRPSLSEQLSSIGAKAAALTADIRKTHGLQHQQPLDSPLCTFPAHAFAVGRLECRYPSPISFYRDRCEYTFHHPYESAEIRMIMYYRDMSHIAFSPTGTGTGAGAGARAGTGAGASFRFRLRKNLAAFPGGDFEATNTNHSISVTLAASALGTIKDIVNSGK